MVMFWGTWKVSRTNLHNQALFFVIATVLVNIVLCWFRNCLILALTGIGLLIAIWLHLLCSVLIWKLSHTVLALPCIDLGIASACFYVFLCWFGNCHILVWCINLGIVIWLYLLCSVLIWNLSLTDLALLCIDLVIAIYFCVD